MNTSINSETLEKAEYLRSRADISYEEAVSMLERFDGDLTRVLIELERANRIKSAAPNGEFVPVSHHGPHGGKSCHHHHKHHMGGLARVLFHTNIEVTRTGHTIVNLPVVCYIAMCFAPHLMLIGVAAMLLFGCHIGVKKTRRGFTSSEVEQFAKNAAANVQDSISNIAGTIRKEFDGDKREGEASGEGGEFTLE